MELLCNARPHASVPDRYVFPPEKRAVLQLDDDGVTLPVVDLHRAALSGDDGLRQRVAAEIVRAGKDFGFFQVVNHGVGEDVVRGFRDAASEFFAMPAEKKLPYCSSDQSKPFRLATSTTYDRGETRYWLDYLKLQCHPVTDELVQHWPAEPTSFRPRLAEFSEAVHDLAQTLLRLVAEGLGLSAGFFAGDLSGGDTQMNVNYYPPCPDPSLTLGLLPHCDRHLLTVLSQGDVAGLQARHIGRWLLVRPVPGALVINFGHQMEIVTNGALASVEHRAVTNSDRTRMSVATLIMPKMECRIGPAPEMVDEATNPAKFREFVFSEFMEAYYTAAASREDVLESFRIHEN
ncbi:2'-deoxymugineic-acid 2'-dioxygenase-like [Lolium rigidum]|uniref:2'-deoxymugineic-acid 2'-dioxygenase-like n=1 Tax=Lolium rigidum TaxID=89674 RepID=UPI001F5CAD87|nr:2'-deoxymugineic-acid 2'-dioxygenase-like [Lolium rigidum]